MYKCLTWAILSGILYSMEIKDITQKYLEKQNISPAGFATAIKNAIGQHGSVSRQTVHNWRAGDNKPDYYFLVFILMRSKNWLEDWARECLKTENPDLW